MKIEPDRNKSPIEPKPDVVEEIASKTVPKILDPDVIERAQATQNLFQQATEPVSNIVQEASQEAQAVVDQEQMVQTMHIDSNEDPGLFFGAGISEGGSLKADDAAEAHARLTQYVGIGAYGGYELGFHDDKFVASLQLGVTLGVGGGIDIGFGFDPSEVLREGLEDLKEKGEVALQLGEWLIGIGEGALRGGSAAGAADTGGNIVDDVVDTAEDVVDDAVDAAEDGAEAVGDAVSDAADW